MSASQRKGKKKATAKKEKPVAVVEEKKIEDVSLGDIFTDEPQPKVVEERPVSKPDKPEAKKATGSPYSGVVIDVPKLLRFIARLKTGRFQPYGNGANFGNHMVKECFTVDGKQLTVEEASLLIRPFTNVSS